MSDHDLGEYAEGMPWQLHTPYRASLYSGGRLPTVCEHIRWLGEWIDKHRSDGAVYGREREYELPAAAVCLNEGGYNFTVLCIACVDAARADVQPKAAPCDHPAGATWPTDDGWRCADCGYQHKDAAQEGET